MSSVSNLLSQAVIWLEHAYHRLSPLCNQESGACNSFYIEGISARHNGHNGYSESTAIIVPESQITA